MKLFFSSCAVMLALLASPVKAENFTKEQIEEIIRNYYIEHPDALMDAMIALKEYQVQESFQKNEKLIEAHRDKIFHNPDSPAIGPKDASVTLVEFYDYNCGACKIMFNTLITYMKENKDLRVVFKEYPIFGENSEYPARIALAVHRVAPEKYFDFYKELMGYQGRVTPAVADNALDKLGLDKEKVKKEAGSKEVATALADVRQLAQTLGATGTPMLVLNSEIIPHALDVDTLRDKVDAIKGKE